MSLTAAILAGGEGTRFRPYTDLIPKPMIPLGPEEKPVADHIVNVLIKGGVSHVVFLVNYKWKYVRNYFGYGDRFGIKIDYSIDDDKYKNTGGSLLKAYKHHLLDSDPIVVWYGDILAPINASSLVKEHVRQDADALLVVANSYQVPVGVAEVNDKNDVVSLKEKPWVNMKVTIGVLTIRPSLLEEYEGQLGTSFDIMGDLIPAMISSGRKVKAYIYDGPWVDVGSLERYKKIDEDLLKEVTELSS
ncbi:nucleotidyltransferase family protein [Acidilobus sp.]|uniref:nucleotidyltransferase family protein n=1 Tax=Acidilobus sp. TaxID=1872109 RepID=UPI003CFC6745